MIGIEKDNFVLDPACGSGGFLLHALDEVRKQAEEFNENDEAEKYNYWHDFAKNNLFGIEINDSIARVAKMNMIIHDDGHTNVIGFDALDDVEKMDKQNHGFAKNRFDVIVTNPPFGAKNSFVKIIILNTINWLKRKRRCYAKPKNRDFIY